MTSLLCLSALLIAQPSDTLKFREGREVVAHLPADAKLPMGRIAPEDGEKLLSVSLVPDDTKKPGPAMIGAYERKADDLIFTPRFGFSAGQTYRATLHTAKPITLDYRAPDAAAKAPPRVLKIYPTNDVLPANVLRFYIYFDRPMRGGREIFDQIVLIDDKGKVIDEPWLIDEIWDEANNCLIIYIQPGRIKWGVMLREVLGPVFFPKREYSLVVRGSVADREGNKIGKDIVKKFRTTAEDRVRVDLSEWKLLAARAGTKERLSVTLPKTFDHRNLQRYLTVKDDRSNTVEGSIEVAKDGRSWAFSPKANWRAADYYLFVDPLLEDVAGNNPLRAFDFDLKAPKLPEQNLRLQFSVK
ncbi:MAG TPA: hypothetical protein VFE62_01070 [Gemmataceae bacterium]|nr:hypothetical protein [Gemmataceae bacterium]